MPPLVIKFFKSTRMQEVSRALPIGEDDAGGVTTVSFTGAFFDVVLFLLPITVGLPFRVIGAAIESSGSNERVGKAEAND